MGLQEHGPAQGAWLVPLGAQGFATLWAHPVRSILHVYVCHPCVLSASLGPAAPAPGVGNIARVREALGMATEQQI